MTKQQAKHNIHILSFINNFEPVTEWEVSAVLRITVAEAVSILQEMPEYWRRPNPCTFLAEDEIREVPIYEQIESRNS